jgi:tetratricopeptide (TPR) repeat protein
MRLDPIHASHELHSARGFAEAALRDRLWLRDPNDARAYVDRGRTRTELKVYDRAIADFDEAIRIDPKEPHAYLGRAWLWATCPDARYRDGKKAVASATKACELLESRNPIPFNTLAAAHTEIGDFDEAVKWQSKAIALLDDEMEKVEFRSRLKLYEEKKAYREPNR